jgi:hypothetical protein
MNDVDIVSTYGGVSMVRCIVGFFFFLTFSILLASTLGFFLHETLTYLSAFFS